MCGPTIRSGCWCHSECHRTHCQTRCSRITPANSLCFACSFPFSPATTATATATSCVAQTASVLVLLFRSFICSFIPIFFAIVFDSLLFEREKSKAKKASRTAASATPGSATMQQHVLQFNPVDAHTLCLSLCAFQIPLFPPSLSPLLCSLYRHL